MKNKTRTFSLTLLLLIGGLLAVMQLEAQVSTSSPRDQLQQLITQLQTSPNDEALREKIIKLVLELKPSPAIPEDANRHFVKGRVFMKEAKEKSDYELAVDEYRQALLVASWWGDAYYNPGVALESSQDPDGAAIQFKLYLLTNPGEKEASEAHDRIYAIEAKKELAAKRAAQEAERAREKQADLDQTAAAAENLKRQTRQILDQLKAIVGDTEYWWYMAGIGGDVTRGKGRFGLNMEEYEAGGSHWYRFGNHHFKYAFQGDRVYLYQYAYVVDQDTVSNGAVFDPDKADFIGTPNGPGIADIVWENSYNGTGPRKPVWVSIDESNGNFVCSYKRPLTNPDRDAVYDYTLYMRR